MTNRSVFLVLSAIILGATAGDVLQYIIHHRIEPTFLPVSRTIADSVGAVGAVALLLWLWKSTPLTPKIVAAAAFVAFAAFRYFSVNQWHYVLGDSRIF
jgi:hypothetical protein